MEKAKNYSSKKTNFAILAIILIFFAVGIFFYSQLPDKIASHWSAEGNVNGFMPKFLGIFFVPVLAAILAIVFIAIPKIDPLKSNIEEFRKYYDMFIVLILLFMLYIYSLTIYWNLGNKFNMIQFMIPAFAILFYYSGVVIEKAKRNWFIGIRTPWTLSSENVWNRTHAIGGKLFKASAIISLFGVFFQSIAIWLLLIPIIATSIFTIVYSFIEFRKESKK